VANLEWNECRSGGWGDYRENNALLLCEVSVTYSSFTVSYLCKNFDLNFFEFSSSFILMKIAGMSGLKEEN